MTPPVRHRSHGGVLLIAVILLLAAASAALAAAGHFAQRARHRADVRGADVLAEARDALIGYAVGYPELHPGQGIGYLPCPDEANTGSSPGTACRVRDHGAFGRLPYRTLGLPIPLDGHGQCLWYAVAGSFKNNPKPLVLNWDSPGQFRIVDPSGRAISGEEHDVIAAILSPGPALPGQSRPSAATGTQRCPGSANAAADQPVFLDRAYGTDIAGNLSIVHGLPGSDFNDRVIWITVDELFDTLKRRPDFSAMIDTILDAAATALQAQIIDEEDSVRPAFPVFLDIQAEIVAGGRAHGRLPSAAVLGVAPGQVQAYDNWRDQLRFAACTDGSACLTVTLADSADSTFISVTETCRALVLFGGERQRGGTPQKRGSAAERADPAQYLEDANLASFTTGTGDYTGYRHYAPGAHRPSSEDLIRCIP